jgi:hypothetical protein
MAELGTFVVSRADEMTFEMATKDSVDSFPPAGEVSNCFHMVRIAVEGCDLPFRIAALPDLMAREAMLAMTSGRASKMMRRTPMGHETRSMIRSSSSFVLI